jgi:hypothetical protein
MNYPETWPDGTPKSMHNAFNWRVGTATAIPFVGNVNHRSLDLSSADNVRTYSKAKKGTKPADLKSTYGRGALYAIKKQ